MNWKQEYQEKLRTAEEAVRTVRSGDRVYGGTASSIAYRLLDALWDRRPGGTSPPPPILPARGSGWASGTARPPIPPST